MTWFALVVVSTVPNKYNGDIIWLYYHYSFDLETQIKPTCVGRLFLSSIKGQPTYSKPKNNSNKMHCCDN